MPLLKGEECLFFLVGLNPIELWRKGCRKWSKGEYSTARPTLHCGDWEGMCVDVDNFLYNTSVFPTMISNPKSEGAKCDEGGKKNFSELLTSVCRISALATVSALACQCHAKL